MLITGPKASGKTRIGEAVGSRTNTRLISFSDFIKEQGLKAKDDETKVQALIDSFFKNQNRRVMVEDFPQNLFQAKYFMRNCKAPSNVFVLNCCKDVCQERMEDMGKDHARYVNSSALAQSIREYNN